MRFVPVQLNPPDPAVRKSNLGDAFQFSPPTGAMNLLQIGQIADVRSDRDDLNHLNLSNNVESHTDRLPQT
jgi:hypothetical protein